MVREIKDSPSTEVEYEYRGHQVSLAPGDVNGMFESRIGHEFTLDAELRECSFPYRNLAIEWIGAGEFREIGGECNVNSIVVCPENGVPADSYARDDSQYELLSQMYVLDDMWRGGGGRLSGIRLFPGVVPPEIWYLDPEHEPLLLDIGYREYLNTLLVTKGATGWQLLFASVDFTDEMEFGADLVSIREMLQQLPGLFPNHDYAPLVARLEERL